MSNLHNESRQYNILNVNCNTEQLRLLDQVLMRPSDVAVRQIPAWWDKTRYPNLVLDALRDRGLIKNPTASSIGLLEQEPEVKATLARMGIPYPRR